MSLSLAKDLGFKEFKSREVRVEFAVLSGMEPYAILEDVILEIGVRLFPTDFEIMVWKGSKRNQLILGTPFLATAGTVINYLKNHLSLGNIRQYVFFPSINFKSAPSATKLPPEEATLMPKKGDFLPRGTKKSEHYPIPKEKKKPLELKHKDVFKDINSVLLSTFDEYGAEEESDGVSKFYAQMRILTPKDTELKDDHTAREKLERTMKLFPRALVFKGDMGDDLGESKPPQERPNQRMEKLKGSQTL
ncbi:unnamed protein product [Microthlaspi erraticum]|uniref:Uncharacterized protein n=1 Tax=Microthlaspi erraticum TaxID=1685480 RepID=A0A6D2JHS7_9BRAS|nr:unnamed protein product [Microthlaspi erraticum]